MIQKPVIAFALSVRDRAYETECSEAISISCGCFIPLPYGNAKSERSILRNGEASYAMTIGHFFTWSTLTG
ncbi:MAG: hypothetical protein HC785_12450 [Calothrix sp. CSU_2_0]|nr:hypothetical protein [Calothrix sp. CSU_2_0]